MLTFGQRYVVRDEKGELKTDSACYVAKRRTKLAKMPYTVKDIRPKAITNAKRAGYDSDAPQVATAHADRATTEIYIKSREVPLSSVRLSVPLAG